MLRGLGSVVRRRPRSKVYGVGFSTATGSFLGAVVEAIDVRVSGCWLVSLFFL